MATPVIMPRQGQSVESCIITEWRKKVGDSVAVGDILFAYETDKSSFEEEAKVDGTLLAIFFEADDDVPCLTNVAVIGAPGEDFAQFAPAAETPSSNVTEVTAAVPTENTPVPSAPVAVPVQAGAVPVNAAAPTAVSPRAKAAAEKLGVDLSFAAPTGPHGRVIERDVLAAVSAARQGSGIGGRVLAGETPVSAPASASAPSAAAPAVEYEDVKMPNLRRVIAKSMHDSLASMAQLTHNSSFDATKILAYRASLKAAPESLNVPKITLNDMIIYAVSRMLMKDKYMNAHCLGDTMRNFTHVHMGVAVDTPRGLLVPTLFHADTLSLAEISSRMKVLIQEAQEGSISPDLLSGGTFTISNLGVYGIESFTPVINPPQVGLLGVDCITDRIRVVDGEITAYPAMGLSLTYDHRAVDGAPASRFLQDVCNALANFDVLLSL